MSQAQHRYFILNKPGDMVSQFVSSHEVNLLGSLPFKFPEGTHAIGRLDNHSEGLLILTTNKKITRLLFSGAVPHKRTYLVQVNNILSNENLLRLQTGVEIRVKNGQAYLTPPCEVSIVPDPGEISGSAGTTKGFGPHTWILITLTEGKFHQVRKMMGAIRHRCKRLIRVSIEQLCLHDLAPGEVKEIEEQAFFTLLNIGEPG